MANQTELATAPADNAAGFRMAVEQLGLARNKDWRMWYDRKLDTVYLRRVRSESDRTSVFISYYCPTEAAILLSLDRLTAELVGVDLAEFRGRLVKEHPELRAVFMAMLVERLVRLPGLRGLARAIQRGARATVTDELQGVCCA